MVFKEYFYELNYYCHLIFVVVPDIMEIKACNKRPDMQKQNPEEAFTNDFCDIHLLPKQQ